MEISHIFKLSSKNRYKVLSSEYDFQHIIDQNYHLRIKFLGILSLFLEKLFF